jgi:hypothetical protein
MNDMDIINQLANARLGAPPAAAAPEAAPVQAAPAQAAAPAPAPAAPAKTEIEKAASKVQPKGADEKSTESAMQFIKIGDKEFTESQITGTMDRYRDLNHKWQGVKPVAGVVEKLVEMSKKNGYDPKPDEVAGLVEAAVQAYIKNPTLGNKTGEKSGNKTSAAAQAPQGELNSELGDNDDDESMAKWEKDNAVSLPPGYKKQGEMLKQMGEAMQQMMQMMQRMGQTASSGLSSQEVLTQATAQKADALTTTIKNNVTAVGITPEKEPDFMMFAMQRGYTPEDFIDPQLAKLVADDFSANSNAPEFARMREVMSRRQAFTGAVEGAPGGAAGAAATPDQAAFNGLLSSAMQKRGMA